MGEEKEKCHPKSPGSLGKDMIKPSNDLQNGFGSLQNVQALDKDKALHLSLSSQELTVVPSSISQFQKLQDLYLDYNDLTELGEPLFHLVALRKLSVVGNDLLNLPENLGQLPLLQELYLNENNLNCLPDSITKLTNLEELNIVGNNVRNLPLAFGNLISLKKLFAYENAIEALPESFRKLENLEVLEVGDNNLQCLPEGFGQLKSLVILNVSSNSIEELPLYFGDLTKLEQLDLSSNRLKTLPESFHSCSCLRKFYADSNLITHLPHWLNNLPEIEEFSVRDNKLNYAPISNEFGKTSQKLRHLDLAGNFITALPDTLGLLKHLQYLHMGSVIDEIERRNFQNGNWMYSLPTSFPQLSSLKELHLDENQLHELPDEFGSLVSLEIFDVGQNHLHDLPESFGNLQSLRVCMLSKNHLEVLPSSFGNLAVLEDLKLDNNLLAELPDSFSQLTTLRSLDLFNNQLEDVPQALFHLPNIIRLDVDKNQFKLDPLVVPQIRFSSKYAPRNPDLKDNWRGRPRQDLVDLHVNQMEEEAEDSDEPKDSESPTCSSAEPEYNYHVLQMAMRRSLSLWKSHSDSNGKERKAYIQPRAPRQSQTYGTSFNYEADDEDEDEWQEGVNPITDATSDKDESQISVSSPEIASSIEAEDWDKELENMPHFEPAIGCQTSQTEGDGVTHESYILIPSDDAFLPSEIHAKPAKKWDLDCFVAEGQFDDADEDNL